jgi:hypothetical protein
MTFPSHTWRCRFSVPLAALGLLIFAGTASAQATVGHFSFQQTVQITDEVSCTGQLGGSGSNTATTVGQFVDTGLTFHVHGTTTQDYRIDWPDGTYLISHSPSYFEFSTNSLQFVSTEAQQDRGTLYSQDGELIGRVTVFTLSHITWRDRNGNEQADPDEITASVEQFRVTCP